jgi:cell division protein FtsL
VLTGIAWILVLTLLLTGVVAVNVAVLRQNVQLDRLGAESAQLTAENAQLQSSLSLLQSAPRVERLARQLGLVQADPEHTTYLQLPPGKK